MIKNDWIKFLSAQITLDGISVAALIALAKEYPNKCYVVDGDGLVVRMAEND